MNAVTGAFNAIEEVMGELYPKVSYRVVMGTSIPRSTNQPVAVMYFPDEDETPNTPIIEVDPNMTLSHIIKSLLNLLSVIASEEVAGSYHLASDIEKELHHYFGIKMKQINDSIINKGDVSLVLN